MKSNCNGKQNFQNMLICRSILTYKAEIMPTFAQIFLKQSLCK
jgi:hypothetical protein